MTKLGAELMRLTVIVKVCAADVSTPPLAVPPLSCSKTVTVAVPKAFSAGVYVSVPVVGSMLGPAANSEGSEPKARLTSATATTVAPVAAATAALSRADALLVHVDGKPAGVITRQDLLGHLSESRR